LLGSPCFVISNLRVCGDFEEDISEDSVISLTLRLLLRVFLSILCRLFFHWDKREEVL
jgi:hypothetical protein